MADYRYWCHSCDAEIAFGSHKPGCKAEEARITAEQERRDFERHVETELEQMDADFLINEALELNWQISALEDSLRAKEKKLQVMERQIFYKGYQTGERYRDMVREHIRSVDEKNKKS